MSTDVFRIFNTRELKSLQTMTTSKGNQAKWYHETEKLYIKSQFQYQDKLWRDDLVEVIASRIGKALRIDKTKVEVTEQFPCLIDDGYTKYHGVYSKDFCGTDEQFITLNRIIQLQNTQFPYTKSIADKWDFILDVIRDFSGLDLTDYLLVMTIIDFLVGNEDRHLSNIGILTDDFGFRQSPLFDFGLGMFEHDRIYENLPFRKCLAEMNFKPFHKDGEKVIDFCRSRYDLNYIIPSVLDFSELVFPSPKAGSYVLNRSKYLGIEALGIE